MLRNSNDNNDTQNLIDRITSLDGRVTSDVSYGLASDAQTSRSNGWLSPSTRQVPYWMGIVCLVAWLLYGVSISRFYWFEWGVRAKAWLQSHRFEQAAGILEQIVKPLKRTSLAKSVHQNGNQNSVEPYSATVVETTSEQTQHELSISVI